MGSYFQMPNGEFAFGTPNGLQYFYPNSLFNKKIALNTLIHKIESKDVVSHISANTVFHLSSDDNQVTFYFRSDDYSPHVRTYYEYQLSSMDPDWVKIADQNSDRYNFLPPGKYVFRVRNDARLTAEKIHQFQPGLVFLDIQMPNLNGFELLEKIPNKNFKIIFTTAKPRLFNTFMIGCFQPIKWI